MWYQLLGALLIETIMVWHCVVLVVSSLSKPYHSFDHRDRIIYYIILYDLYGFNDPYHASRTTWVLTSPHRSLLLFAVCRLLPDDAGRSAGAGAGRRVPYKLYRLPGQNQRGAEHDRAQAAAARATGEGRLVTRGQGGHLVPAGHWGQAGHRCHQVPTGH